MGSYTVNKSKRNIRLNKIIFTEFQSKIAFTEPQKLKFIFCVRISFDEEKEAQS